MEVPPGAPRFRERSKCRNIIIVAGTPGVGKTAFSKALAREISAKRIDFSKVVVEHKLHSGFDRERDTHVVDIEKARLWIECVARFSREPIVLDTHIIRGLVPERRTAVAFVLRCHPKTLLNRLRKRGYSNCKIAENAAAEMVDASLFEALNWLGSNRICEMDMTNLRVNAAVEEALAVLAGKRKATYGRIDWIKDLGYIGNTDRLLQYLSYEGRKS